MSSLAIGFVAACLVSLGVVPLTRLICVRFDVVDHPDRHRKLHEQPVAFGGGVAVFLSTVAVSLTLLWFRDDVAFVLRRSGRELFGLLEAATVLLIIGFIDDMIGLRGRQKLAGQVLACSVLIVNGLVIQRLQFFGWTFNLGSMSVPVTMIWLLAAVNAVNLLDGINGLAAIIGIIDCSAIALLAEMGGHRGHALVAATFAGSLLGFLRYNFPHAKLFLGDAGSMLIGLLVGVLSVETSLKGTGTVLLATPLCLMTIPLFDSAAAMMRRKLTGRSIFSGDRGHLHHCLTKRFGSIRAVAIVAVCCGVTASAALTSIVSRNELVAVISGAAIVVMFVVSRMFGHAELRLLASRLQSTSRSFFRFNRRRYGRSNQSSVRVQGNREWDLLWSGLQEAAQDLPIHSVELNVNAPMLQEAFHGSWKRSESDAERTWRFDLPLAANGYRIGRIRVEGERQAFGPAAHLEKVLWLFETFESQLVAMLASSAEPETAGSARTDGAAVIARGAENPV